MTSCAVLGCESSSKKGKWNFFRFPRDPSLLAKWIQACGRKDTINVDTATICSRHFSEDSKCESSPEQLKGYSLKDHGELEEDAVPTLRLPKCEEDGKVCVRKRTRHRKIPKTELSDSELSENGCAEEYLIALRREKLEWEEEKRKLIAQIEELESEKCAYELALQKVFTRAQICALTTIKKEDAENDQCSEEGPSFTRDNEEEFKDKTNEFTSDTPSSRVEVKSEELIISDDEFVDDENNTPHDGNLQIPSSPEADA